MSLMGTLTNEILSVEGAKEAHTLANIAII
jgi:hypothetical protein